jgi:hypothetical protein
MALTSASTKKNDAACAAQRVQRSSKKQSKSSNVELGSPTRFTDFQGQTKDMRDTLHGLRHTGNANYIAVGHPTVVLQHPVKAITRQTLHSLR